MSLSSRSARGVAAAIAVVTVSGLVAGLWEQLDHHNHEGRDHVRVRDCSLGRLSPGCAGGRVADERVPDDRPEREVHLRRLGRARDRDRAGRAGDVFAAASPKQPAALYAKGLVDKPVEFATNTLVLIVPKSNPAHITSVSDITKPGVKLVICNATVPCGDYARTAFTNLGITTAGDEERRQPDDRRHPDRRRGRDRPGRRRLRLHHRRQGGRRARSTSIRLPAKAKPGTQDFIAVVKAGKNQAAAKAFVATVLSPQGQATLQAAGFGKP